MKPSKPSTAHAAPLAESGRLGGLAAAIAAPTHPCSVLPRARRGFALVITLSLMILLTILAVGLLTLSSVSLRTASQAKDMQTARANARLAMMIAIGELQKTIGPDQRVTAPADLKFPTANMPHWVGVYGNAQGATYTAAPSGTDKDLYKPTLLNWLVSGNEATGFAFSKAATDFGAITGTPPANPFLPTQTVANIATATAFSSDLTINGTKAALLVGPNSADSYDATQRQFVAAPIVATKNATNQTTGGYAYWVGDEGVKARINLQDNYRQQSSTTAANTAKSYSFVSQRSGVECMRTNYATTAAPAIGTDYDPSSSKIKNLVTTGQLPLLNGTTLTSVAKARFHDISAHSSSVLADCYAGGLKRNLSAALQGTTPPSAEPIFPPVRAADFGLPTWGLLRSWASLKAARNSPGPPLVALQPRPYQPGVARFGPVISMCALGLGIKFTPPDVLQMQYFPTLVLWNPYAATIAAHDYEIGMATRNGGKITISLCNVPSPPPPTQAVWDDWDIFSLADGGDSEYFPTTPHTGNEFFRFRVEGSEIPPGESHIYTVKLANNETPYQPGVSTLARAATGGSSVIGHETRFFLGSKVGGGFNQAYYPSADAEVHLQDDKALMSLALGAGERFEAILTEPGKLSTGFTAATPVYQAVLDTSVRRQHDNNGAWELQKLRGVNLGLHAICALRSQMPMEAHHVNSYPPDLGILAVPGKVGLNVPPAQRALRWIASSNPLAPYTKRTQAEKVYTGGNPSHGCVMGTQDIASTSINLFMWTGGTPPHRASVGLDQTPKGGQPLDAILADVLPDDLPLLSLGQLQHAPFSAYGFTPTYCFGNSKMEMRLKGHRDQTYLSAFVAPPGAAPTSYTDTLYDLPWHLNRALWDRYFVSSVPDTWTQADIDASNPLPNARMTYVRRNGKAPVLSDLQSGSANAMLQAAANLMVAGGFNINSTSVDAWRAVLTGTNKVDPSTKFANPTFQATLGLNAMMPRFARDVRADDSTTPAGVLNMWDTSTRYLGNREMVLLQGMTDTPDAASKRLADVAGELAVKIVEEVRARGPFISLAHFINRDLGTDDKSLRGALQAAIDKCSSANEVNPSATYVNDYKGSLVDADQVITEYDSEGYLGGPLSDLTSPTAPSAPIAYRNRFDQTSKTLTQADVLTTIGPALSARSDTFVIRSYGEATNPQTGVRTVGAWCEAVIQRMPDYVNSANDASVLPGSLNAMNKTFGRALKVVSFRWLSAGDI